jgi:hypothetical protein
MPNTTNYSFPTPADTDLVKDGAAAIRNLGNAVDSTLKTQIDAQIPKTIVDAKGDLIAATAADTVARLAVGTDGQVLLADSTAATGLAWGSPSSGSMTSLATGTLSGTTVTISSISGSYKNLVLRVENFYQTGGENLTVRMNGITTSTYNYTEGSYIGNTLATYNDTSFVITGMPTTANNYTALTFEVPFYASAISRKGVNWQFSRSSSTSAAGGFAWGVLPINAAITSLSIISAGSFGGGTYTLYGVN